MRRRLQLNRAASNWCGRRDSNPHILRYWYLKPARLPIPPRPPSLQSANAAHASAGPYRSARQRARRHFADVRRAIWNKPPGHPLERTRHAARKASHPMATQPECPRPHRAAIAARISAPVRRFPSSSPETPTRSANPSPTSTSPTARPTKCHRIRRTAFSPLGASAEKPPQRAEPTDHAQPADVGLCCLRRHAPGTVGRSAFEAIGLRAAHADSR